MRKKISLILPVLNEQNNILIVYNAIKEVFSSLPQYDYEIIFIDDGSTDATLNLLKELSFQYPEVVYISFSRNFGKDNALYAGFSNCTGNAAITMDADMQHTPGLITKLIDQWEAGYEVVYYYRKGSNVHASALSKFFSKTFYYLVNALATVKLENGVSDFRIIDRKVVNVLKTMNEDTLFYRGLIKWVGFKQLGLAYVPSERESGRSRYRTKTLFTFAINNVVSLSVKPLSIAIYLGFFFSFLSVLYVPYAIYSKLNGVAQSGWASVIVTIAFFGGLNLMILGIVGLYLGKTFMQGKNRPPYIVSESNINK